MSIRHGQAGFTLLEVIIAITLASLATLLGATVLRMGADFYERAHQYMREQQELRGTLRLLRQELQAVPKGVVGVRGNAQQIDLLSEKPPASAGRNKATLVSIGCVDNGTGKFALVHLVRQEPGLPKGYAEALMKNELAMLTGVPGSVQPLAPPTMPLGGTNEPIYEQEILIPALTSCSFSYLARDEKMKIAAWLDEWTMERTTVPLAVRLRIGTAKGLLPAVVIPVKSEERL